MGQRQKVSWEEGLYTPRGSSSSATFLMQAASACVPADDDYVPPGGQWGLKRLDSGMESFLDSCCSCSVMVASYFLQSRPNRLHPSQNTGP